MRMLSNNRPRVLEMEDDASSVVLDPLVDFWGVELSAKQGKVRWPVEEVEPDVQQRLELRQACLGAKAKSGERNVVELTTENENGEEVTHTILSLTVGGVEQSPLFLEVFSPVVFNLAAGSGPVHIVGSLHTEIDEDYVSEDEEDDDTNRFQLQNRKRTANSPPTKPAKTRKLDAVKENGESTDMKLEYNEEEESDEEEEDSEESSDEEEDEEEGEELETTPQKPMPVSKPKAKSAQKPAKSTVLKELSKTPQKLKGSKTLGKITLSAPNTPEQRKIKKGGTKTTVMNMEDMKEKLKKTPNLPKKLDKFGNYVQHNFKVTDDKVKKQLWEYAQKIKAVK